MEKITTVGIDLAKNGFSLHGTDASGKVVLRRTVFFSGGSPGAGYFS
jgi:hypothetical protein